MKKALITGITGQDGAYLAQLLLGKGYTVFAPTDEAFAKLYKEWTGDARYGSPLVDHLPLVKGVPTPKDVLGYYIGAPRKLTYYADILKYYRALAAATPRVRVESVGRSDEAQYITEEYLAELESEMMAAADALEEHRGEVAFAAVGEDGDDGLAGIGRVVRQPQRSDSGRTARNAGKNAFFRCEAARHFNALLHGYVADRHEWHHIGCADARMFAGVYVEVD